MNPNEEKGLATARVKDIESEVTLMRGARGEEKRRRIVEWVRIERPAARKESPLISEWTLTASLRVRYRAGLQRLHVRQSRTVQTTSSRAPRSLCRSAGRVVLFGAFVAFVPGLARAKEEEERRRKKKRLMRYNKTDLGSMV